MSAVVVDQTQIAMGRQIFHQGLIAFFVFRHTVRKLDDAANVCLRHSYETGEYGSIVVTCYREFLECIIHHIMFLHENLFTLT